MKGVENEIYIFSKYYIYLCRFRYKSICTNLFIFKHSKAAVKVRINRKKVERGEVQHFHAIESIFFLLF